MDNESTNRMGTDLRKWSSILFGSELAGGSNRFFHSRSTNGQIPRQAFQFWQPVRQHTWAGAVCLTNPTSTFEWTINFCETQRRQQGHTWKLNYGLVNRNDQKLVGGGVASSHTFRSLNYIHTSWELWERQWYQFDTGRKGASVTFYIKYLSPKK